MGWFFFQTFRIVSWGLIAELFTTSSLITNTTWCKTCWARRIATSFSPFDDDDDDDGIPPLVTPSVAGDRRSSMGDELVVSSAISSSILLAASMANSRLNSLRSARVSQNLTSEIPSVTLRQFINSFILNNALLSNELQISVLR